MEIKDFTAQWLWEEKEDVQNAIKDSKTHGRFFPALVLQRYLDSLLEMSDDFALLTAYRTLNRDKDIIPLSQFIAAIEGSKTLVEVSARLSRIASDDVSTVVRRNT